MNHVFAVAVHECDGHLPRVARGARLAEVARRHEVVVHLAAGRELENEVDALVIEEVAKEAQDVGVQHVALDLHLALELREHVALDELLFVEHLRGGRVLGPHMSRPFPCKPSVATTRCAS